MRALFLVAVLTAAAAHAHFVVHSPTPIYQQSLLGDPQKADPCGADGTEVGSDAGILVLHAGQPVTITIQETIFHPGWYRVAIGETGPGSLPPVPPVDAGPTYPCGTADVESPPVYPVVADNMLNHSSTFVPSNQDIKFTLPANHTCTNCTLQVIEFMSDHGLNVPGGCFYHHCIAVTIEPPDAGQTGTGGGSGAGGRTGTAGGGSASSGGGSASSGGGTASSGGGSASSGGGSTSSGGGTASAGGGTSSGTGGGTAAAGGSAGGGGDTTGGCSCNGAGFSVLLLGALLTLVRARRRD